CARDRITATTVDAFDFW
nr:immunoglobulin heavy chain junction region [Macaca mulatta]MOY22653.1 immunoglobulin heavy chain junction region [Macaca mulatta]MOY23068.1 immunoglobulin heavy chain junction region [Macaca mulatta]MOY23257.1 immunoglobulin heavy chain junction region [Macaca mulatta]MOY23397.1 immunoglobulin heavy chain junction region [Macaca mulatta]